MGDGPDMQKVLIIDDTPENIHVLMSILRDEYAIVVATVGEKALQLVTNVPIPDIILLDINMPGMDGYEVCSRLKADEMTCHIPVIFITAMSAEEDERKGLELGAVDYIHKPFNPALVKMRIRNQLDLKQYRDNLEDLVEQRTMELTIQHKLLETLNANLEQRVAEEVEKNLEKDRFLIHQARFAAMGEMLNNIAHQWRQPLNNVGLLLQCAQLDYDDGRLDRSAFKQLVAKCMEMLQFMSQTIDDFQVFFKPMRERELFDPYSMLEKALSLVRSSFEKRGISINVNNYGTTVMLGFGNEFTQAILNILNNAGDVLTERGVAKPFIEIRCSHENNMNIIDIRDNGGGITLDIMDKIFDPYFTTKFMSQGTGIGLYMTKMIIEKNMGGKITARNTAEGAEFIIELPVHSDTD
ncbi:MAG: hybrid sensor histidine kinase/response regulator [Pedobacter sp.]